MFGSENSMEPAARPVQRKPTVADDIPIREATRAEIRSQRTPAAAQADEVAKQHNLYTADKWSGRVYYHDYQQKSEVMRASASRISTKLDDRQTVSAMLDLAESRGWQSVRLRGSDDFKREAWVQAQVRGLATEGYNPKPTDLQESERRKEAAKPVQAAPAARTVQPVKVAAASKPEPVTVEEKQKVAPAAKQTKQEAPEAPKKAPEEVGQTAAEGTRAAERAVWGTVETAGQKARENDTPKPAVKTESENPGAGMKPAEAA